MLDCEKPNEPSRRTATAERKAIVSFFMVDASSPSDLAFLQLQSCACGPGLEPLSPRPN